VPTSPTTAYAETLRVPLRWWAITTMFHASGLLALLVAGVGLWSFVIMAGVVGITIALLVSYGSARIEVSGEELVAGRARIPLRLLADPRALDADATRDRIGPLADARAYLLVRPYVARSVAVDVTDPGDPTPYWLISTRHPRTLAHALSAAVPRPREDGDDHREQPQQGSPPVSPDLDRAD
jgi:hypothetical protein